MNALIAENSVVTSRIFTQLIQKALPSASIEPLLDDHVVKQIINFHPTNLFISNWHLHWIELIEQMRLDERLKKIFVIFVTIMMDIKYVMSFLKARVNDICGIPVKPAIMVQKVNIIAKNI